MKHTGTQTIDTERLILRRFSADDCADMLANWAGDPAVQHEYGEPVYETADAVDGLLQTYLSGYARADFYRWAIEERASGKNIGMIAFCRVYDDIRTAEIEYCIGGAFQGHGYAGEALAAVITYSFLQTDFERLEAYHRAANVKSGRVLEKSAMQRTETVERFRRAGESPAGEVCYCITRAAEGAS